MTPDRSKLPKTAAILALGAAFGVLFWAFAIGWWMDFSDEPRKADLMVVLAGKYDRPFYAAELFARGFAPEVWISRPYRTRGEELVRAAGIPLLPEEEIDRRILLARGVPPEAVRLYGDGVLSTYNEALELKREARPEGKTVLVVTSRAHARRAKLIFREILPSSRVLVAADPSETPARRWWKSRTLSRDAVLESVKTVFYLLGGHFVARQDQGVQN